MYIYIYIYMPFVVLYVYYMSFICPDFPLCFANPQDGQTVTVHFRGLQALRAAPCGVFPEPARPMRHNVWQIVARTEDLSHLYTSIHL